MSPFVAGLASIIPGLGLFLLKKRWGGLLAFGLVAAAAIGFYFAQTRFAAQLFFDAFFFIWLVQAIIAISFARNQQRLAKGEMQAPRQVSSSIPVPSNLSRKEKQAYKVRETVKQQLTPDERLYIVLSVIEQPPASAHIIGSPVLQTHQYTIGLTDNNLVRLEYDMWGKLEGVSRIPISSIQTLKLTGLSAMRFLEITIDGKKKVWQLAPYNKEEVDTFISRIQMQKPSVDQ
ncbi:MAG TPA: hypothetical protein VN376_07085 [Longilinea sp.]|nr:hypothetical protein [Longilinea sp.]